MEEFRRSYHSFDDELERLRQRVEGLEGLLQANFRIQEQNEKQLREKCRETTKESESKV